MIKTLKAIYRRQMFSPSWLGIFVNPYYLARTGLRDAMAEFAAVLIGRLLDVGCGTKPYRSLFTVDSYVGLDVDTEISRRRNIADHFYDGNVFPFADGSFDSVLCNQVLEHVFNPNEFLGEISRVLKPGGKLLLTVPFVWDEHEQPYDYARYSSFGLRALMERQGFRVLNHRKLGADLSVICQLVNAYLFKTTQSWPKMLQFFLTFTFMAFVTMLGLLSRWLLPANPDLYLDHVILVEKTDEFLPRR